MTQIQTSLFKEDEYLMKGFERPEFTEKEFPLCRGANKKPMKDLNYFYVDYYGQDKQFAELKATLKKYGAIFGVHRISSDLFVCMLREYAERHPVEV